MTEPRPIPLEPRPGRWPLVLALLGLAVMAHLTHRRIDHAKPDVALPEILPNVDALRIASLGHHTSLADLYWLKWVQYVGTPSEARREWPQLEALTEQVIGLDPLYGYAYQSAGVVLASVHRYDSSTSILERGMERIPDRWQLPFLAGFNHWHGLGNLQRGGELLLQASRIPGGPRYLSDLAARLFSSSGSIEDGIALLEMSLRATDDPLIVEELEHRREQLHAERALRILEAHIADHRHETGAPPASLDRLEGPAVQQILGSEFASTLDYDPKSGAIRSSLLPKRLVLYRPPKVPEALAAP